MKCSSIGLQSSFFRPISQLKCCKPNSKYLKIYFQFLSLLSLIFVFAFATLFVHRVNLLRLLYLISVRLSNFAQVINANSLTTFHTHTLTHRQTFVQLITLYCNRSISHSSSPFPSQIFASWFDAHVEQLLRYIGQLDRSRYGYLYGAQSDNAQRSGAIMRAAYVILIFQCCIKFGWHFLTIPDAD